MAETYLYKHFDRDGKLLYVGISLNPFYRTSAHARNAEWFILIAKVEIEQYDTRAEALEAEKNLIRKLHPSYNIVGRRSFTQYVERRERTDDPIGDVVYDYHRKPFPEPRDFDHLRSILVFNLNACDAAVDAAEELWKEFLEADNGPP